MEKETKKFEIKSGLEIHQQLDSGKLYCRCPSILRNETGDWIVKRKLHIVAGESGEVDIAAKHEASKEKEFIYQGFKDTNCLVEFDEQPPMEIDREALKIALQIALLLNCEIVPITQIMRKTVLDGSNTSGFQRTALIARNGFIETSFGRVAIDCLFLEEDSARPANNLEDDSNSKFWKLDRLGIPLVEIATGPHMHFAEQVKEAALKIGEILRACKVKRGIGTIRQDLNISTKGHPRVEIKGFQDPATMIKTVELEAQRQKNIVDLYEKVKDFKTLENKIVELNDVFKNTNCNLLKNVLEKKGKILGFKAEGFAGLIGLELIPGKRFGSEISDYAKMYGVGGIIHSDEKLEKYNLSTSEIEQLTKALGIKNLKKDAWIIIADDENRARKAIESSINRINLQIKQAGIKEVRRANIDGTSSYLRPMPGSARMYPETDLPLLHISRDFINEVRNSLPKLRTEIKGELKEKGLSEEMINIVLDSGMLKDYEYLLSVYYNPTFVAKVMFLFTKEIASHEKLTEEKANDIFSIDNIENVLNAVTNKEISEGDVKHVMEELSRGKLLSDAIKIEKKDLSEIEGEIAKIVKEKPGLNANAYMGLVMARFKGKVSGAEVMNILKKIVK
jgi:glutamyl-tRNA(Gln) amidotransferase subunit E